MKTVSPFGSFKPVGLNRMPVGQNKTTRFAASYSIENGMPAHLRPQLESIGQRFCETYKDSESFQVEFQHGFGAQRYRNDRMAIFARTRHSFQEDIYPGTLKELVWTVVTYREKAKPDEDQTYSFRVLVDDLGSIFSTMAYDRLPNDAFRGKELI